MITNKCGNLPVAVHNRNLQISKAPLEGQAQGTRLFKTEGFSRGKSMEGLGPVARGGRVCSKYSKISKGLNIN